MKLLVDKIDHKILFAEAKKETVDLLFHILSLPLGTIVSYLPKGSRAGCVGIGNLSSSLASLGPDYIEPGFNKKLLLHPNSPLRSPTRAPLTDSDSDDTEDSSDDDVDLGIPPERGILADRGFTRNTVKGYVTGETTYMVMDDLSIEPMSTISAITRLNELNLQDASRLEERVVSLNKKKRAALIRASLTSRRTVLTDVFLGKKPGATATPENKGVCVVEGVNQV